MKKILLLVAFCFSMVACANNGTYNGYDPKSNEQDNPNVGSRAASSVEFPSENQMVNP